MAQKYTQITPTTIVESHPRHLPSDIILEILLRVTVETLNACKYVSKEWRDLISDPVFTTSYNNKYKYTRYFMQHFRYGGHTEHRLPAPIFVSLGEQNEDPSAFHVELPEGMKILALCKQGIVLCENLKQDEYDYFVGKPMDNKQWEPLPNPIPRPDAQDCVHGIVVLESRPLLFKVVRLEWVGGYKLQCEIFSSKKGKWEEKRVVVCPERPMITHRCPAISVSGSFYCQTYNGITRNQVIAFNGLYDSFHMFPIPDQVMYNNYNYSYKYLQLQEFDRSPVLVFLTDDDMLELWKMKESITHLPRENGETMVSIDYQWCKKMEVDVKNSQERRSVEGCNHEILYTKILGEIVIFSWHSTDWPDYTIYPFHDLSSLA